MAEQTADEPDNDETTAQTSFADLLTNAFIETNDRRQRAIEKVDTMAKYLLQMAMATDAHHIKLDDRDRALLKVGVEKALRWVGSHRHGKWFPLAEAEDLTRELDELGSCIATRFQAKTRRANMM